MGESGADPLALSDRILLLDRGRLAADGRSDHMLTGDYLRTVYGVSAGERPLVVPLDRVALTLHLRRR